MLEEIIKIILPISLAFAVFLITKDEKSLTQK